MSNTVSFFVRGTPKPGGSKRHIGRGRIIEDCKGTPAWREAVTFYAGPHFPQPLTGPLTFTVTFYMQRPSGHYNRKGLVKPSAPKYPIVKPDATKLLRSTEDALTGIAWRDDAQVVTQWACKRYTNSTNPNPGAMIAISTVE